MNEIETFSVFQVISTLVLHWTYSTYSTTMFRRSIYNIVVQNVTRSYRIYRLPLFRKMICRFDPYYCFNWIITSTHPAVYRLQRHHINYGNVVLKYRILSLINSLSRVLQNLKNKNNTFKKIISFFLLRHKIIINRCMHHNTNQISHF